MIRQFRGSKKKNYANASCSFYKRETFFAIRSAFYCRILRPDWKEAMWNYSNLTFEVCIFKAYSTIRILKEKIYIWNSKQVH